MEAGGENGMTNLQYLGLISAIFAAPNLSRPARLIVVIVVCFVQIILVLKP